MVITAAAEAAGAAGFETRPATDDDEPWLYALTREVMRPHVEATWGVWDEDWQRERFRAKFRPEAWRLIVVGGVPAGGFAAECRETELFLASLYLLPAFQGRGIGTAVVRSLLAEASSLGLAWMTLDVVRSDVGAKRLYERLSFAVVGEDDAKFYLRARAGKGEAEGEAV